MKKEKQIAKLSKAIDLITERIDGQMFEEKELAAANELLCQILAALKNEK
jgi:hypothetical protein